MRVIYGSGLAAMLVALPSSIAYGVAIYSVLGGDYVSYGVLAGILEAQRQSVSLRRHSGERPG